MRWRIRLAGLALATLLIGCSDDPQAMLETAQLEEQQNNPEHARELYERILRDHPETMAATVAKERLAALGTAP